MPLSYGAEKVKCPFYKKETKNCICCEGSFSESCIYNFGTSLLKKKHQVLYCNNQFQNCPHFLDVNEKYR